MKKDNVISEDLNRMSSPETGALVNKGDDVGRAIIYNQDGTIKILVHDVDHLELRFKKAKTSITDTVKEFSKFLK